MVWRYIDRFFRLYFQGRINTRSTLSRELVQAVRMPKQSSRNAAISILARSFRDKNILETAAKDHATVLRQAVPVDIGEASGAARQADRQNRAVPVPRADMNMNRAEERAEQQVPRGQRGKCPLCLSEDHKYVRGDYGHTDV